MLRRKNGPVSFTIPRKTARLDVEIKLVALLPLVVVPYTLDLVALFEASVATATALDQLEMVRPNMTLIATLIPCLPAITAVDVVRAVAIVVADLALVGALRV